MFTFDNLIATVYSPVVTTGTGEQDILFPTLSGISLPAGKVRATDIFGGDIWWTTTGSGNRTLKVYAGGSAFITQTVNGSRTRAEVLTSFRIMSDPTTGTKLLRWLTTDNNGALIEQASSTPTIDYTAAWTLRLTLTTSVTGDATVSRAQFWKALGAL